MKAHWFYYLVKVLGWIGLKLFFGGIRVIGREGIPDDGALIFTPNHQGAFMDALVVGTYLKKPVSFLTRADIFKPWAIPILESLNMMPIYRMRDGIQSLSQNDAIFEACFEMLSEEKSILIFPEGNHNIEYYLRPLSKGTARLALDARNAVDQKTKIYVIPTGVNYFSHKRPLAKVIIVYGKPILLEDYMVLYQEHKQKAYNAFREDLDAAMKETLILGEKDEHYEERKEFIFQPAHCNLPFEELRQMAHSHVLPPGRRKMQGVLHKIVILFFSIYNAIPLLILRKVLSGIKDEVFYVSLKFLVGGVLHLVWWLMLFAGGTLWLGWEAGSFFVVCGVVMMYARQELISY